MSHKIDKLPLSRSALKIAGTAGTVAAVIFAGLAICSGWFMWKLIRCMNTVQRTLPTIKKASECYLEKNDQRIDEKVQS